MATPLTIEPQEATTGAGERAAVGVQPLVIHRVFARASQWTFEIKPVRELLQRYVGDGRGWADPYAGKSRLAEWTNDLNPNQQTTHHLEAADFADELPANLNGVLYDPPYSYRQITEHYREYGRTATAKDTSYNFYRRAQIKLAPKIRTGGIVISFGWNSNGFGVGLGFVKREILLIAHGLHHNDTICTVEEKMDNRESSPTGGRKGTEWQRIIPLASLTPATSQPPAS
jgi:hypothetical protein